MLEYLEETNVVWSFGIAGQANFYIDLQQLFPYITSLF